MHVKLAIAFFFITDIRNSVDVLFESLIDMYMIKYSVAFRFGAWDLTSGLTDVGIYVSHVV